MTYPSGAGAPYGQAPDAPTAALPSSSPLLHDSGARPPESPVLAVPLRDRDADARAPRRRPTAPLPWLPWALVAALLSLLLLMVLAGALVGNDDPSTEQARPVAGPVAAEPGTLTAGGADVLVDAAALGRLASLQGQEAAGRNLAVQAVVADEGFWVGPSAQQRTFVYLTPQARESSGESSLRVRQGQRVDLSGTVTGLTPADPARLGVTDAEGARQLAAQKAYIRASEVRPSSS